MSVVCRGGCAPGSPNAEVSPLISSPARGDGTLGEQRSIRYKVGMGTRGDKTLGRQMTSWLCRAPGLRPWRRPYLDMHCPPIVVSPVCAGCFVNIDIYRCSGPHTVGMDVLHMCFLYVQYRGIGLHMCFLYGQYRCLTYVGRTTIMKLIYDGVSVSIRIV